MTQLWLVFQPKSGSRLLGKLGELEGNSHGDELLELDGARVISVKLLENGKSLVVASTLEAESREQLLLDNIQSKLVGLLLIGGRELVASEKKEGNDGDELLEGDGASLGAVTIETQRGNGGGREVVSKSLKNTTNVARGEASAGGLGLEGGLGVAQKAVQPDEGAKGDTLSPGVNDTSQVGDKTRVKVEAGLSEDVGEVLGLQCSSRSEPASQNKTQKKQQKLYKSCFGTPKLKISAISDTIVNALCEHILISTNFPEERSGTKSESDLPAACKPQKPSPKITK
jgi:hypothetical protein